MRIALCISGYFTNKVNDNLSDTNYIHQNIIDKINKKIIHLIFLYILLIRNQKIKY